MLVSSWFVVLYVNICPVREVQHWLIKITRKWSASFCTWDVQQCGGLPAFSLDQTHSIKTLFILLRAKRGSHSTLLRAHEEVNTLPRRGWIEQSDAHIIQATVQTDWQLLGKTSYVSAWDRGRARERDRDRKGRDCRWWRWCSRRLCLSVVCRYCASVNAGGQVCQDRAAFPQRPQPLCWNAERKLKPKAGSDGWTDTLVFHCHTFTMPSGQDHSERLHYLTSNLSCIREEVQINSWHSKHTLAPLYCILTVLVRLLIG